MIKTEILEDGRIHTYSGIGKRIIKVNTGAIYDDAIDVQQFLYEETDEYVVDEQDPPTYDELLEAYTRSEYELCLWELGLQDFIE